MQYWTAGLLTTLLLFASVLAHELGHSIVALAQGLKVNGITLLLFGGVSKIQGKASRPRNEFLIAFAGPAVSLVIGVVLVGWWIKFGPIYEDDVKLYHGVLFFTGWMNLLVAGFNLLPGYPMDGGRVLRSAVWGFTGDTKRATRVAYIVGKFVFYALIGWGAWQILSGDIAGGIWIAMIGYFLMTSARSEIAGEQAKQLEESDLESIDHLGFSVGVATRSMPPMIESSWSIEQMTHQGLPEDPLTSMPVGRQGELIGFVLRRDLDQVPIEHKGQISVGELMNPDSLRVISTNESFRDALRSMDRNRLNQLVVMDADYVVGIITREDIVRALLEFKTQGMHAEPMDRDTSAD